MTRDRDVMLHLLKSYGIDTIACNPRNFKITEE